MKRFIIAAALAHVVLVPAVAQQTSGTLDGKAAIRTSMRKAVNKWERAKDTPTSATWAAALAAANDVDADIMTFQRDQLTTPIAVIRAIRQDAEVFENRKQVIDSILDY